MHSLSHPIGCQMLPDLVDVSSIRMADNIEYKCHIDLHLTSTAPRAGRCANCKGPVDTEGPVESPAMEQLPIAFAAPMASADPLMRMRSILGMARERQ